MVEVIGCNFLPQAVRDVLGQHGLRWMGSLVFSAYVAPLDIADYISIDAAPVHCLSGLCLGSPLSPGVCNGGQQGYG